MMQRVGMYHWADMDGYQMVELPYKGDRLVMQILLPNGGAPLAAIEENLKFEDIELLFRRKHSKEMVKLQVPKFKVKGTIPLTKHLTNLGMSEMFGCNSNFSGIDGTRDLYVSDVMHQVLIEVNEEGAEASVAAVAVGKLRCDLEPSVEFRVDKPFLFLIRDRLTGILLFLGRVMCPSE